MLLSDRRPWGYWEEYLNEPGYRVKRLVIHPSLRLSKQRHMHRSERWVVVQGEGRATLDLEIRDVRIGDVVCVPVRCIHRLQNTGVNDLIIIETQLGLCLEEDIERIEDDFGRS